MYKYIYFHLFFQQIPPATSCSLLTIFLLVCQKYCTPFFLHPFSDLIFWTTFPFLLRWWAFCVFDSSHTFLPAASVFFSFSPLLLYPSSSSVLPLLPPFLLSSLSRVYGFSRTDTCEGDLELSMVRHQPEGLDQLQAQTQFTRKELQSLYRGFKNVGKQLETLVFAHHHSFSGLIKFKLLICSDGRVLHERKLQAGCDLHTNTINVKFCHFRSEIFFWS